MTATIYSRRDNPKTPSRRQQPALVGISALANRGNKSRETLRLRAPGARMAWARRRILSKGNDGSGPFAAGAILPPYQTPITIGVSGKKTFSFVPRAEKDEGFVSAFSELLFFLADVKTVDLWEFRFPVLRGLRPCLRRVTVLPGFCAFVPWLTQRLCCEGPEP